MSSSNSIHSLESTGDLSLQKIKSPFLFLVWAFLISSCSPSKASNEVPVFSEIIQEQCASIVDKYTREDVMFRDNFSSIVQPSCTVSYMSSDDNNDSIIGLPE